MSHEINIPRDTTSPIPGKNISLAEIDKEQLRKEAAIEIQKVRRETQANGSPLIKPADRWKDATSRAKVEATVNTEPEDRSDPKKKWRNAKNVIIGLQEQEESDDTSLEEALKEIENPNEYSDGDETEQRHRFKHVRKMEKGRRDAKIMESPYFLEMIDPHHRYGSNLKAYHTYWMKHTDNKDNFFQWLDVGEGRNVDLGGQGRPRSALDSEKVRYLSREQRANYLVKVDDNGLLRWAKNDEKIDTTTEFKYSKTGIAKIDEEEADEVPPGEEGPPLERSSTDSSDSSVASSDSSAISGTERAGRYVNDETGLRKIFLISPQAVMNRLLRKTTRKNTWIYVTDMSYRLYVGLKQSGSFQHSSFLHGSRVTSAGLITIRDGQLRKLSPLSGHYRCSTKHFQRFLHALEYQGVDMSKVYVSRSYTIMVGMEGISRVRKARSWVKHKVEHVTEKTKEKLEKSSSDERDYDA